jgi:hypothetical protein
MNPEPPLEGRPVGDDDYWTPEPIENEAVAEWLAEQPGSGWRRQP